MAIDRVGQKVVSLKDCDVSFLGITLVVGPRINKIYTVSGFSIVAPTIDVPGIHVSEIVIPPCPCGCGVVIAWPIECFRPVDERKTDISEIVALGAGAKQKEPA